MVIVLAGTGGFILIAAVITAVYRLPRLLDGYLVGRSAESQSPVLYATLIRSPRELPGRPSAASTERQVYVITDAQQGARANREG